MSRFEAFFRHRPRPYFKWLKSINTGSAGNDKTKETPK